MKFSVVRFESNKNNAQDLIHLDSLTREIIIRRDESFELIDIDYIRHFCMADGAYGLPTDGSVWFSWNGRFKKWKLMGSSHVGGKLEYLDWKEEYFQEVDKALAFLDKLKLEKY